MGIFSDKCQALIDPSSGRALTGERLESARRESRAPRCGNRVRKAARFCNTCGSPAPGGWWRCPQCRKWIGNDSKFCPHCNSPLYPEARADMAGGVWSKAPGMFAQRFEIGDVKRLLKKDLQVQAGTVALLLDGGKYKGMIEAGSYDPDALLRKLNYFGDPPPRSVVLVDAGDVALPLHIDNLRSSEGYPLEFYGEIILRFRQDNKAALAFIENRFKDARELSFSDLADPLASELRHAVDALCVRSTVDDLVRDPERRLRLQDEMTNTLQVILERSGIDLIHVSSAEFTGEKYEELAEKMGDVEAKRREIEYDQRMAEMLSKDQMTRFKSEHDLLEYQEALAHEHGISQDRRQRERAQLQRGWQKQDELDDLAHAIRLEREKTVGEIDVRVKWDGYERDKQVKDAETAKDVRSIAFDQEKTETEWAMDLRRQKNAMKAEARERDAKRRAGMSVKQLLMDVEDPDQRRDLLEMFRIKLQAGQTPEQVLAQAAASSPAAADALARMKEGEQERYRTLLEEMKTLYRDTADRQDKNLKTMLEPAKAAAERKDGSQTIVK